MDTLTFVASIVNSVAWPVAALVIAGLITRAYRDSFEDDE